ncbi:hypothetical protein ONZ45_g7874 [Pleurotus djamor]|nr:hypothetical protein ONZ45_g7874 [Pleurotus djamor]
MDPTSNSSGLRVRYKDPTLDPYYQFDLPLFKKRNEAYPWQLWWCLAVFFALVSTFQLGSFIYAKLAIRSISSRGDGEGGRVPPRRSNAGLKRIPIAIVNTYRVVAFRWTVNFGWGYTLNVSEVLLTVTYIAGLLTWSFINTTSVEGQTFANLYWSNRIATLATSQFPLVTALGTKNNLISYVTGVSYDKLNYMHRMTSRVAFALTWVHGIGRIVKGIPQHEWETVWLRNGVMSIVGLTIICIVSLRPVRARQYELFFYVHFVLVLAFLIGSYYHSRYRHFDPYIIACFIIWGLDRLIRVIRLIVFNYTYLGSKSGDHVLIAKAELLAGDMVRLTLRRPLHFHWLPGQSAYLIMPSVSNLPFEAHPFTIASFDPRLKHRGQIAGEDEITNEKEAAETMKELVFLVSPQEGATRKLLEAAAKTDSIRVFLDGPYGFSPDIRRFDTTVLLAGGSGVTHTLPVFLEVIEKARQRKTQCSRLIFVWAIRDIAHINWAYEALYKGLQRAPSYLDVNIRAFITGETGCEVLNYDTASVGSVEDVETPQSEKTAKGLPSVYNMPGIQVTPGRPDLKSLLHREAEDTEGKMVVTEYCARDQERTLNPYLQPPPSH